MPSLKKPMPSAGRWNRSGIISLCCLTALFCAGPDAAAAAEKPSIRTACLSGEQIKIRVAAGQQARTATLADNASAAFRGLLTRGPLTIAMQDYGGFEKVGPLGARIVRCDEDIAAVPGDIILHQGDKVTVCYGGGPLEIHAPRAHR